MFDSAQLRQRYRQQTPFQWTVYGLVSVLGHFLVLSLLYWVAQTQVAGGAGAGPEAIDVIELTASPEELLAGLGTEAFSAQRSPVSETGAALPQPQVDRPGLSPPDNPPGNQSPHRQTTTAIPPERDSARADVAAQDAPPASRSSPSPLPGTGWRNPFRGLSQRQNNSTQNAPIQNAPAQTEDAPAGSEDNSANSSENDPENSLENGPENSLENGSETNPDNSSAADSARPSDSSPSAAQSPNPALGSGTAGESSDRPPPPTETSPSETAPPGQPSADSAPNDTPSPGSTPAPNSSPGSASDSSLGSSSGSSSGSSLGSAPGSAPVNASVPQEGVGGSISREGPAEAETPDVPNADNSATQPGAENTASSGSKPGSSSTNTDASGSGPTRFSVTLSIDPEASLQAYGGKDIPPVLARATFQELSVRRGGGGGSACSAIASQLSPRDIGQTSTLTLLIDADSQDVSILQAIGPSSTADALFRCVIENQWEFEPARGENGQPVGQSLLVITLRLR